MPSRLPILSVLGGALLALPLAAQQPPRQDARALGIVIGQLPPGPHNAITDVPGVRVGHTTVTAGDSINTGVTVVLPHGDNPFQVKVPAAIVVGNGFGKLAGSTQVQELGELESPIALTCTLCVPRVADALLTWLLGLPGNENVRSANPVVAETNDGFLNDIRQRPVTEAHVLHALAAADTGPVPQGSVGAGRGTMAFGWKGGIGSASRRLPPEQGGWTVGVLVQSNYGGDLTIDGVPFPAPEPPPARGGDRGDGSIIMVVATDAPLAHRNLERLARRALAGLARTGSSFSNGSGDYVIAFSTVPVTALPGAGPVANDAMNPLFRAVIEATEEAILNSLFLATTVHGHRGTARALPLDRVRARR